MYNLDTNTSNFLNLVSSHNFLPYVTLPTRITGRSRTLIDNIFSNCTNPHIRSGNLTSTISDHLPQFFIYPNMNKTFVPRRRILLESKFKLYRNLLVSLIRKSKENHFKFFFSEN